MRSDIPGLLLRVAFGDKCILSPPLTATTDRVLNCSHVLRMMMTMTTIEMVLIPFTGKAFLRAFFLGGIRKQSRKGCLAYSGSIRSRKQCERGLRETHFRNVPLPYVPGPRPHPSCVRTPGRGECELLLLLHKFKNCYGVSAAALRCGGSMCASQLTNTVNSRRSGVIPVAGFCADLDEAHCNHEGACGKYAGVVPSSRAI